MILCCFLVFRVLMQKMSRDRVKEFEKSRPSDAEIQADTELTWVEFRV